MSDDDTRPDAAEEEVSDPARRRLLRFGLTTASVGAAGVALGAVVVRMPMPAVVPGPPQQIRIGDPSAFPIGSELVVDSHHLLIRRDDEGMSAMSLVCTHLGCVVRAAQKGFDCPCHGSRFASDGRVLSGPAPRDLPWFRIRLLPSGQLIVDHSDEVRTGKKTKIS